MERDAVSALVSQAKVLLLSILGVIALGAGPNREGALRIPGPLGHAVTYMGIAFLLTPWFFIPFQSQPRLAGTARFLALAVAAIIGVGGALLYALSLRALLPAFRGQFSEFTPGRLVTSGPYEHVRHPIYLAAVAIVLAVHLGLGATVSILFFPLCYGMFWSVSLYEEKWILEARFPAQYAQYRQQVRHRMLPAWAGVALGLPYLGLAVLGLLNALDLAHFKWIV
ncbi:MAG: isoprenylcysteine carboxylmethyltransferase family protein [Chloroflexota bacterium]